MCYAQSDYLFDLRSVRDLCQSIGRLAVCTMALAVGGGTAVAPRAGRLLICWSLEVAVAHQRIR